MSCRMICLALALILVAIGAYVSWPRKADLRAFDPPEIARLETVMWRDYYDKRYPALFYHLYELSRTQFGFSPLDSFRIALAAARAAKALPADALPRGRQRRAARARDLLPFARVRHARRLQC
ncbi:hypothetical protein [Bradyrhizobium sp. AZCC 1721]|uniref:hypothetical protein n=1 Tax=Bradyrhizobium sp. AZCC 1721 TaxID=3117016 RepID=UPI002FF2F82D